MTTIDDPQPRYSLDSNIFLAYLLPQATRAPDPEVEASSQIMQAIEQRVLTVIISSIVFGEIRWVYLREGATGYDVAEAAILHQPNIQIQDVTVSLAVQAAEFRKRYYSRANPFSYNDGLVLATALSHQGVTLISIDPHLLATGDVPVISPSRYVRAHPPQDRRPGAGCP